MTRPAFLLLAASLLAVPVRAQESWPDLAAPARIVGGGESDAAAVVGIESYAFVPPVSGAEANAKAWHAYFTKTRGAPAGSVKLLLNNDAAREDILAAAEKAAARAGPDGTLWFVFIGHGAPSADGKDGLLVGVDAQQKARSLQTHSVARAELLRELGKSRARRIVVVLDACFSGRGPDGATLAPGLQPLVVVAAAGPADPRMVVLTAAKGDQFAGSLPGAQRPAFSYLVLGALRGWAGKTRVTAGDMLSYASEALEATLRGRNQTPDLTGAEGALVAAGAGEKGPDLAALAAATAGRSGGSGFHVTAPPVLPAQAPLALDPGAGLNFRDIDVASLDRYHAALELDKSGGASPQTKAKAWRALAREAPQFADLAEKRAAAWELFAEQGRANDAARRRRLEARDADWAKLSRLLPLAVIPAAERARWCGEFAKAYSASPGLEPAMAKALAEHTKSGAARTSLLARAKQDVGIEWIPLSAGEFRMGHPEIKDAQPVHRVSVAGFEIAKAAVTNQQYRACVEAGACTAPKSGRRCNWGLPERDDHPVTCVSWKQARAFSQWVGGRLPSEAEWEYAARSGGKDREYPWGSQNPTCDTAVLNADFSAQGQGCGRNGTWPVCSKPAGNTEQGLCDMAGNVWNWAQDVYHNSYSQAPEDSVAWEDTAGDRRVIRGGGFWNLDSDLRSAGRNHLDPESRDMDHVGFRPAR